MKLQKQMGLSVVEDPKKIIELQGQFIENLKKFFKSEELMITVGYQSNIRKGPALWFEELGFWLLPIHLDNQNKYWNAFGIGSPKGVSRLSITCEINFSTIADRPRKLGGVFLSDGDSIIMASRGIIGGGRKGCGKGIFFKYFTGQTINIDVENKELHLAIVGTVNSKDFGYQLSEFLNSYKRIKSLITEKENLESGQDSTNTVFVKE